MMELKLMQVFTKNCFRNYRYVVYLLSLFALENARAQCPNPDFDIVSTVCVGENIAVDNNSTDAIRYEWDFCASDIIKDSIVIESIREESLNGVHHLDIVKYQDMYFGFAVNRNTASLLRLDFGNTLDNTPRIHDIGNIDDQFSEPIDIGIFQEHNNWYGIVVDIGQSSIHRLSFEDGIESRPSAEVIEQDVLDRPVACSVIKEDGFTFIQVANYGNGNISTFDFGNSIENSPKIASYTVSPYPLGDIDFYNNCGTWFGFTTIYRSNGSSIYKLTYDNGLSSPPIIEPLDVSLPFTKQLTGISTISQNDVLHVFFQTSSQNGIYRLDFKDGIDRNPVVATLSILDQVRRKWGLTIVKDKSNVSLFSVQREGEIFRGRFLEDCYASTSFVNSIDLNEISYSESGEYAIELTAYNAQGVNKSISKTISVNNKQAPAIAFQIDGQCYGTTSTITATANQTLTSTDWSINNDPNTTETRTGETITYDFPAPGTYPVTLEVQSENGCSNRLTKEITIYEPPAPDFTAPSGQICTNGAVNFANTTDTKGADSLITYRWLVDGELVSEEANPAITFAEGGSKTVRLEAGIPGCTEVIEQTVNVQQGPTVGFAVPQVCEGAPVAFENLTSGEGITGYQWDFGDGGTFSSTTAESPTYAFEAAGTYEVALSVSNAVGCLNTYRQEVVVYQQPSVGFLSEVACVGTPTQFTDTTTAGANANIIAWQWDFGDGTTAEIRNPAHVYQQPGTYTVRLTAQSTAGCEASVEQSITVESPVAADFLVDRTCPTEEAPYLVQLTDVSTASEGEEVTQWFWTVEGQTFTTPNVTYAFREPGRYEVSLTAFASSACNATVTKTIQIDSLPTVAFTYEDACVGSPLAFESEVSMTGGDTSGVDTSVETISGYTWSFGEAGTALEANPTFVFEEAGTYEVRLTVQTESGCTFTTSQPVTIGEAPVAEFTASATFGGAPLTVNFTHPADAPVQYRWDFGDAGTSSEPNPTFTFTELGTYPVTLTATNAVGCIDTFSQTITVVEPVQDVQLTDIEVLDGPNGSQQLVLTLQNAGTLLVPGLSITVDLGDAASLQALVDEPLLPGQTLRYPLSFQLPVPVPNQSNAVRYVCASVMLREADFEETDLDNNRACVSLNQQLSVEAPFPNPATEEVQLSLILPQASPVALRMMNVQGKVMRQQTVAETQSGLNTFLIPVRGLPVGSYILQVVYRGEQQRFRVAVGL